MSASSHSAPRRLHAVRTPEHLERSLAKAEADRIAATDQHRARHEALYFSGRLLIAAVFIASAVVKATGFDAGGAGAVTSVFWASIAVELVAGAMLAVGLFARRAAMVLLVWIGAGVIFFHGDLGESVDRAFTLANLAIAGGLFVLVAHGAGMLSVDRWMQKRSAA